MTGSNSTAQPRTRKPQGRLRVVDLAEEMDLAAELLAPSARWVRGERIVGMRFCQLVMTGTGAAGRMHLRHGVYVPNKWLRCDHRLLVTAGSHFHRAVVTDNVEPKGSRSVVKMIARIAGRNSRSPRK
jgi:hypothetical protein